VSNFPSNPGSNPFGPLSSPPGSTPGAFPTASPDPLLGATKGKGKGKSRAKTSGAGKGVKGEKATTKRLVSSQRTLAILMALVAALAVLVAFGVKTKTSYEVRIGTATIPAQTAITASELTATSVAGTNYPSDAFVASSPQAAIDKAMHFIGKKTSGYQLVPGQELLASMFSPNSGVQVPSGDVLVSISASVSNAVGGTLAVGDHVDVFAPHAANISGALISGAEVISILPSQSAFDSVPNSGNSGKSLNQAVSGAVVPGIYILAVPPTSANLLASNSSSLLLGYCVNGAC
jgi:Flp pilus assembly protein CpaB